MTRAAGEVLAFLRAAQQGVDDEAVDEAVTAGGAQVAQHVTGDLQGGVVLLDLLLDEAHLVLVVVGGDLLGDGEGAQDVLLVVACGEAEHLLDEAPLHGAVEAVGATHVDSLHVSSGCC